MRGNEEPGASGTGLLPPRELEEEPNRAPRFHPMPHFRDDDRVRRRLGPRRRLKAKGAVYWRAGVVEQHPGYHMNPSPNAALRGVLGQESGRHRRFVELGRPAKGHVSVGPLHPVATQAFEFDAEHGFPPGLAHHPRAVHKGRPMAHMLPVTAIELRNPFAAFIEMEADDCAFHAITAPWQDPWIPTDAPSVLRRSTS